MDWSSHFPAFLDPDTSKTTLAGTRKLLKDVEVADIGCGFGGLLVGLAPILPETLMVGTLTSLTCSMLLTMKRTSQNAYQDSGMEIRISVLDYVTSRIHALRMQQQKLKSGATTENTVQDSNNTEQKPLEDEVGSTTAIVPGNYENITGIRANTMKFLPNFFAQHQLSKIFVCFPDPHFKARKHKQRIISESLNAEYAYVLRPGGLMYTITDVEEYYHWVLRHFEYQSEEEKARGGVKDLWERLSDEELAADPCVQVMSNETEESKKVTRNNGNKYVAVFRRTTDPEWST